ncbi:Serine/threonine-protein phosphatase 2A activator 2 [Venturia inaequalis]|nr:Serine/threonine-protein phosphatase 2A activator 2 [Venturia inaequalis]
MQLSWVGGGWIGGINWRRLDWRHKLEAAGPKASGLKAFELDAI